MDGHFATAVNVHFPPKLTSRGFAAFDTLGSDLPFAALCTKVCFGLETMTQEAQNRDRF